MQIDDLIPSSLDNVIRAHRDLAQCYLSTEAERAALTRVIPDTGAPIRGRVTDWRFMTYRVTPPDKDVMTHVHLLGDKNQDSWITSLIVGIDLGSRLVATHSGSLYRLEGAPGEGEPTMHHLLHVCAAFHEWGRGKVLGVPHVFY